MKRLYLFLIVGLASCLTPASAYAGSGVSALPVGGLLVAGMIVLMATICFYLALKIFGLLKGGELASAWQVLAISFVILLISEAMRLIDMLNIANLGDTASMLIRLIGIATVMIGISKIKRALS
jgi:hypothetical protein